MNRPGSLHYLSKWAGPSSWTGAVHLLLQLVHPRTKPEMVGVGQNNSGTHFLEFFWRWVLTVAWVPTGINIGVGEGPVRGDNFSQTSTCMLFFWLIDIESVNLSWLPPYWEKQSQPSYSCHSFPVSTCTRLYQILPALSRTYVIIKVLLWRECHLWTLNWSASGTYHAKSSNRA